jgi:hypothetical protein
VADVSWSHWDGQDCIRLSAIGPQSEVEVRTLTSAAGSELPPMGGRQIRDGHDVCFLPRFAFVAGTPYTVLVDGVSAAVLLRPESELPATTEVLAIYPSASEVPRNLLRFYVSFSARMSEGEVADHVRLVHDAGETMNGSLLSMEHELWDSARRRLTVLLDPARIKRGLVPHRQAGYPLRSGETFQLVVDDGFRDARGIPIRAAVNRPYEVGGDERRRVVPTDWALTVPSARTIEPLEVAFERTLDHGLLARCLRVIGPDGTRVDGTAEIGFEEQSWRLRPTENWRPGPHHMVVDDVLEDVAGNSVTRVFDRDLTSGEDEPRGKGSVALTFSPH